MKIVLLEFVDEYLEFLAFVRGQGGRPEDYRIIALELKLQNYLKRQGAAYETTLPYFDNDSHRRMIVRGKEIMDHVADAFVFTDEDNVSRAYLLELKFHLLFVLYHVIRQIEIIDAVCAKYGKVELFACVSGAEQSSLYITDRDRFLGQLVALYAGQKGLPFNPIGGARKEAGPVVRQQKKRSSYLLDRLTLKLLKAFISYSRKKVILIPGDKWGFAQLKREISKNVQNVLFVSLLPEDAPGGRLRSLFLAVSGFFTGHFWVDLNAEPFDGTSIPSGLDQAFDHIFEQASGASFRHKGVDFLELLRARISQPFKLHLQVLYGQARRLKLLVRDLHIQLIISPLSRYVWSVVGELSKTLGIRSLFVSHGAHPRPVDEVHEMEMLELCRGFMLGDYTDIAIATPVQADHLHYFKQKYPWVKNGEIRTGPLNFADLSGRDKREAKAKLGFSPDEIVVTHATTVKNRKGFRGYFIETADEFISSLSDIVRAVEQNDKMRLVIRPHPGFSLNDEELRSLLPVSDKYNICSSGPFSDILAATDILLSYSSTAIDEALLNRIPVVLYDKWARYNHFQLPAFDPGDLASFLPVCYVSDPSILAVALGAVAKQRGLIAEGRVDFSRYAFPQVDRRALYEYIDSAFRLKSEVLK
ncbi:MAG: hypothetical protein JW782_00900 [Candidatus Saganbacteria bacterium]|nr:hypothetical protein [Candidatus Saganbacteria bacterium]